MDSNKGGSLLSQIPILCFGGCGVGVFPKETDVESLYFNKSLFSRMGGLLGKSFDSRPTEKKGRHLANKCPLSDEDEEDVDDLLFLCKKIIDFWVYLFALFGVS